MFQRRFRFFYFRWMDSIWLNVEDELNIDDESSGSFLGVFNEDPSIIAASLPRPTAPLSGSYGGFTNKMQEGGFGSCFMSQSPSQPCSFEYSHMIHSGSPFLSVF